MVASDTNTCFTLVLFLVLYFFLMSLIFLCIRFLLYRPIMMTTLPTSACPKCLRVNYSQFHLALAIGNCDAGHIPELTFSPEVLTNIM